MADIISEEKVCVIMDAFNSLADRQGTVETKMLGVLMKRLGENPSQEEVQEMINEVDKDGTGPLIFPNFLYMMAKKENDEEAEEEIREAFKVFDGVRNDNQENSSLDYH